jgi:hypothetical protein
MASDGRAGKHVQRHGRNIGWTLRKGDLQSDHAKSVVEILAERSRRNFRNQVVVRRRRIVASLKAARFAFSHHRRITRSFD